ncbi:hypothetical protein [Streptomyces sp. WZ-12]|uniref:hypothetical protein n=1 Tax=Streptomyces sp. WZ-12 TaxID=3030210 RepID=UPI002381829B|nr:hypothetical protein [Streptomyces sp. WZ-12]
MPALASFNGKMHLVFTDTEGRPVHFASENPESPISRWDAIAFTEGAGWRPDVAVALAVASESTGDVLELIFHEADGQFYASSYTEGIGWNPRLPLFGALKYPNASAPRYNIGSRGLIVRSIIFRDSEGKLLISTAAGIPEQPAGQNIRTQCAPGVSIVGGNVMYLYWREGEADDIGPAFECQRLVPSPAPIGDDISCAELTAITYGGKIYVIYTR